WFLRRGHQSIRSYQHRLGLAYLKSKPTCDEMRRITFAFRTILCGAIGWRRPRRNRLATFPAFFRWPRADLVDHCPSRRPRRPEPDSIRRAGPLDDRNSALDVAPALRQTAG